MALNLMARLQLAGNRAIALLGGGTTWSADPSADLTCGL
jgi:tyrosyl-tRNA synthetase